MFWGLIMEPQKRYSQTVKHAFHVSMAAIDVFSSTEEPVQVMCSFENRKYLLCTLNKNTIKQCALDLNFEVGDKVTFLTNGESHVHLTGYLTDDPIVEDEEMEEEEEGNEDLGNVSQSNIVSGKRQKKACTGELGPPAKKSKTMKLLAEINSQDEDDSDDSDVNLSDIIQEEDEDETTFLEEEEDDDESGEEEAAGDDDEEGDEEEEDDEDEEDSDEEASSLTSDEEEEEVEQKPKMNGTAKKGKEQQSSKKDKKQKQVENATTPKSKAEKKKEDKSAKPSTPKSPKQEGSPQKKTVEGGVIVEDIKVGNGQIAKPGKMVQVYYEGRFKNNNKMFDSSTKGNGFKFRLGKHEVIKGWDVGVSGMKVGGKRRIICPPHMAYGAKGSPPTIPPNSTLVFEVDLKNVN